MSDQEGFSGGFLLGTLVGGVVGGVIGAIAASRQKQSRSAGLSEGDGQSQIGSEESIESARRSLEDKISQLNLAIDDVRQQLGGAEENRSQD